MFSNVIARGISTSLCRFEMMQITKMETFNKRGTKKFKKEQYKKWQKKGKLGGDLFLSPSNKKIYVAKKNVQVLVLTLKFTPMEAGPPA